MASAANQLRETIRYDMNVPVEIQLDGDGNPAYSTGRDGSPEYRYFLQGHKITWVPEAVHEAIQRAQAGDGASFAVTKHRAPKPWAVVHLDADEPGHGYSNQPSPTPAAPPVHQQQPATRPAPTPARRESTDDRVATALASQPRRPLDAPAQRHLDEPASDNGPMYGALCAAIRTAAAAEKFAASIGRPLAFETQDIRAIAATLFIRETGGR